MPIPRPPRPRRPGTVWIAVLALGSAAPAAGREPFARHTLEVPGRALEAFAVPDRAGHTHLVILSVAGTAPDEERHVTLVAPPATPGRPGPTHRVTLPSRVVALDAADLDPAPGVELALLSARSLRIVATERERPLREYALVPALPLPPRTRGLGRLAFLGPWAGDGVPSALLPSLEGARYLPLQGGPALGLPLSLATDYWVREAEFGVRSGALDATIEWPQFARGDDDGDGRDDVFALSRYAVQVFRNGPDGLPAEPSRRVDLRPFGREEELRHLATELTAFARDLDGDGLTDLVLHRTFGTLLESSATTDVFHNGGDGADPAGPPATTLGSDGAFGTLFLEDFDGDGRVEALQILIPFGVLQIVRVLVTEKASVRFRLHRFEGPGLTSPRVTWEDGLVLPLDFDGGRVAGILPTMAGDWNDDGVRDLLYGESVDRIAVRLGFVGEAGPGFGPRSARQEIPGVDRSTVADFDGDGLDDLVVWDSQDEAGRVHLLRNLGVFPGAGPSLEAVPDGDESGD